MSDNQATATPTQKYSSNSDAQYSNNPQTQSNKRPRVSSSTSTDDVYINQNEMQEIIKRTLNVALKTFENEMRNCLDAKLLEQAERIEKLESQNYELKKSYDDIKERLKDTERKQSETEHTLFKLENQTKTNAIKANENEQYSRRNNLRIFGLPKNDKNENSKEIVHSFIKDNLHMSDVKIEEISAAHRVGFARNNKPQPMIVRFATRECRMSIIRNRKTLKHSPFVITEDLTNQNVQLLNRARNHLVGSSQTIP